MLLWLYWLLAFLCRCFKTHQLAMSGAVIENEFGEISIDRELVKQNIGTTEEIFEVRLEGGV